MSRVYLIFAVAAWTLFAQSCSRPLAFREYLFQAELRTPDSSEEWVKDMAHRVQLRIWDMEGEWVRDQLSVEIMEGEGVGELTLGEKILCLGDRIENSDLRGSVIEFCYTPRTLGRHTLSMRVESGPCRRDVRLTQRSMEAQYEMQLSASRIECPYSGSCSWDYSILSEQGISADSFSISASMDALPLFSLSLAGTALSQDGGWQHNLPPMGTITLSNREYPYWETLTRPLLRLQARDSEGRLSTPAQIQVSLLPVWNEVTSPALSSSGLRYSSTHFSRAEVSISAHNPYHIPTRYYLSLDAGTSSIEGWTIDGGDELSLGVSYPLSESEREDFFMRNITLETRHRNFSKTDMGTYAVLTMSDDYGTRLRFRLNR